ncbi:MAG: DUF6265 family protein [Acidobacteria bacterium]|nr:DUF6265 family protein [Acidobacteriota bacterium]
MQREKLRTISLGTPLILLGLVSLLPPAIQPIPSEKPALTFKVEDLSWISGDWETAPGRMQIDEHWSKVAGGSIIGMSRTVAGGKTVFFEFLRIESRGSEIYYVAHPRAKNPGTDFKLVRLDSQEAVFENMAHDFPKRIIYRKNGDGTLTARIEGDGTEKEKPQEFQYRPMQR